ncbi:MAG: tetratricopeptide repeat protein [Cellvibrionaceae bacterium]
MAFREARYLQALEAFLQAEQKGDSSPTLTYNTALTYYKLERYDAAAESFERLLKEPEWRDLARFHLGLVAEKQGNNTRAVGFYRSVEQQARSAKLRNLADSRLKKWEAAERAAAEPRQPADRFSALFNVATGTDDNAFGLQDDTQLDSSAGEDSYQEYFGWGQYYLSGSVSDGWRVHGFAYNRRYADFGSLDVGAYSLGLSRHQQYRVWQAEFGFSVVSTSLDGDDLTDQNKAIIRFQRPFNATWISLAYMPSRHNGGAGFSHLDGWQHVAHARWRVPVEVVSFDLEYRWEHNDRDDLAGTDEFFSYSPTRHSLGVGLDWHVSTGWEISLGADYRISDYDGTNRLTDSDGVIKEKTREADRLRLQFKTQWQISPNLRFGGRLEVTDNQENFDTYSYDKREMSLMVEYLL